MYMDMSKKDSYICEVVLNGLKRDWICQVACVVDNNIQIHKLVEKRLDLVGAILHYDAKNVPEMEMSNKIKVGMLIKEAPLLRLLSYSLRIGSENWTVSNVMLANHQQDVGKHRIISKNMNKNIYFKKNVTKENTVYYLSWFPVISVNTRPRPCPRSTVVS